MEWKSTFREDIKAKMSKSKEEYQRYKQTQDLIYLQQACNKLFSAFENYLMLKYNRRTRSYVLLQELVKRNAKDSYLLSQVVQLHYFYYNSDLQMDRNTAETLYVNLYSKISRLIL